MDAQLKQKWVEALRSGEFKQGKDRLLDSESKYCCLGVLCVVQGWHIDRFSDDVVINGIPVAYRPIEALLKSYSKLVDMNDNGNSFQEIARYIEREL